MNLFCRYNLIKSDATRHIHQQRVLKAVQQGGIGSSISIKPKSATMVKGKNTNNFQILNGQLSDTSGPIRLLDKPTISPHQSSAEPSQSMMIGKEKLRRSIEQAKQKLYEQENSSAKKPEQSIQFQNRDLDRIKGSPKRTIAGRSKSLSVSNPLNKLRFKIGTTHSMKRMSHSKMKKLRRTYDHDWNTLTDVLASNIKNGSVHNQTNNALKEEEGVEIVKEELDDEVRPTIMVEPRTNVSIQNKLSKEAENLLSWNEKRTTAILPQTSILFERNEYERILFIYLFCRLIINY